MENYIDYNISEVKPVWVVWGNKDLTEGRGNEYIRNICELKETAIRVAKGQYIQGTDCPIKESIAIRFGGDWYTLGNIIPPTPADYKSKKENDSKFDILKRMEEAGFTKEEINQIQGE